MYKEDELFNYEVIKLVSNVHNLKILNYERHRKINNTETDVYSLWITNTGVKRVIIFELKKRDIKKLVEQAITRKLFSDYIYIVYNSINEHTIINTHNEAKAVCRAIRNGIGVIYYNESQCKHKPLLLYPAKYQKSSYYKKVIGNN